MQVLSCVLYNVVGQRVAQRLEMNIKKAREHIDLARKQCNNASVDSWEPAEPESCVSNVFYAYENVIVAASEAFGIRWTRNHYDKADLASKLAQEGKLTTDVHDLMLHLNDVRKDISYGEPGSDLLDEDLYQLVVDLEGMIDEVEEIVAAKEHKTKKPRRS
jgi:hypothetical protein